MSAATRPIEGENAQWYGPDAPPAQPIASTARRAASSFAACLLFPVPEPFGIPPTTGQ